MRSYCGLKSQHIGKVLNFCVVLEKRPITGKFSKFCSTSFHRDTDRRVVFKSVSVNHTTVLWPFYRDHLGELVPEENFWTLWCKGRLTEADTRTIRLGASPSGLTSTHLHHPPFFTGRMPFLPPNQQCQSTEGN